MCGRYSRQTPVTSNSITDLSETTVDLHRASTRRLVYRTHESVRRSERRVATRPLGTLVPLLHAQKNRTALTLGLGRPQHHHCDHPPLALT